MRDSGVILCIESSFLLLKSCLIPMITQTCSHIFTQCYLSSISFSDSPGLGQKSALITMDISEMDVDMDIDLGAPLEEDSEVSQQVNGSIGPMRMIHFRYMTRD